MIAARKTFIVGFVPIQKCSCGFPWLSLSLFCVVSFYRSTSHNKRETLTPRRKKCFQKKKKHKQVYAFLLMVFYNIDLANNICHSEFGSLRFDKRRPTKQKRSESKTATTKCVTLNFCYTHFGLVLTSPDIYLLSMFIETKLSFESREKSMSNNCKERPKKTAHRTHLQSRSNTKLQ